MPQTMVEAFARGLVDKIMLEAFDVLDTNSADADDLIMEAAIFHSAPEDVSSGNHSASEDENAESMSETEFSHIDVEAQIHEEEGRVDYGQQEVAAAIAKMVCGLRNVHIGDSSYVLPPVLSTLERQVKKAVGAIELHSSPGHVSDSTEVRAPQGQGDVDQAAPNAVFDAPIELEPSSTTQRKDKESSGCEAAKVTVSLLHRMIEDLQTKSTTEVNHSPPIIDEISHWEEEEETFLQLIDCDIPKSQNPDSLHLKQSTTTINSSESLEKNMSSKLPPSNPPTSVPNVPNPLPMVETILTGAENCSEKVLSEDMIASNDLEDAIDEESSLPGDELDSTEQTKADCFSEIPIERSSPIPSPPRSPASPPPGHLQPMPGPSDILLDSQRDSTDAKRKRKRRSLFGKAKRLISAAFSRRKH